MKNEQNLKQIKDETEQDRMRIFTALTNIHQLAQLSLPKTHDTQMVLEKINEARMWVFFPSIDKIIEEKINGADAGTAAAA